VTRDEPVPPGRLQTAVPRDLETICLKCLEKNPHRRYSSAAELGSDLERFLAGQPILARRASPLERAVKWSRRNPAWAVAVAIGALAIIGFVAGTVRHNRQLQAEVKRANESTAEAKRQKSQVIANLNKTHETLLGMLTNLWQEAQLSGDESHRELRESLLKTMLHYYNEVPLDEADADLEMRLTKALVKFYSAHVHHYLGEYEQAEAQFFAALPTLEAIATANRDNSAYRRWWALCCYRLGVTLTVSNEPERARQWLREALNILSQKPVDDLGLRSLEARCRIDLARLDQAPDQIDEAITQAERSASLWRSILAVEPDNDEHRWNLCVTLNFLTRLVISRGNVGQAEAFVTECAATADRWNGSASSFYEVSSRTDLADSYRVLGHATADQSRYEEALAHFEAALQLLEKVQRQKPDYTQAVNVAHGVYWSRAIVHQSMGFEQEALLDWNRCVEVSDGELRDAAWLGRARYRLDKNDVQQAAADADELLASHALPPEMLFDLATIYCRCAEQIDAGESLESGKRIGDGDELAARAVKCLARCHAAGFFSDPSRRHDLQTAPALSVLRSRPDFEKLLNDVAALEE
jgi:tetratricopeptide (TPR) repeat protein